MKFINERDILCSDLNDLREYSDTSWNATYSFPNNIIVYYKDSVKISDTSNTVLMEFIINGGNMISNANIKSVKFDNDELRIFTNENLVIIDFKNDTATRVGKNGVANYRSTISNRNAGRGYQTIDSTVLFNSNLYDYVRLENGKVLISPENGSPKLYDLDNGYYYQEIGSNGINTILLAHDKWTNRVWGFDNSGSRLGYISDRINGNFLFGDLVPLNISSYNATDLYCDIDYIYIGYTGGVVRFHKSSGNTIFFTNFDTYGRSINYNSITRKLNNIIVGTSGNGAMATIKREDFTRIALYGEDSIFAGNNYYGVG